MIPRVLDPGDATIAPLLMTGGEDSTICRMAMATTADGSLAPAKGKLAGRGRYGDDPRWARRLPWVARMKGAFGPNGFLVSGCLALAECVLADLLAAARDRAAAGFQDVGADGLAGGGRGAAGGVSDDNAVAECW